ncbi:MAG TPA: HAMP domain-containing sensor histidine kinase [Streptosporangiaceae bacterium]
MSAGSLRTRVAVMTLPLLAGVLIVVAVTVTALYRASLDHDLRSRLTATAAAMGRTWPSGLGKSLVPGLTLEGISTEIHGRPQPASGQITAGTVISASGSLLVLRQTLPDGTTIIYRASENQVWNPVRQLLLIEIAVSLAALALAALLLFRGTLMAVRPLADIAQTALRIAAGDRTIRLRPTRTETEVGRLAAAFDQMVDALDAAIARAERTEAAMKTFLADASHELRTPIAALQATAETLLREQPRRPERDAIEASIARDAARLGQLAGDLLGLARLEGRHRFVPLDLGALARDAADQITGRASGVQITLNLDENSTVAGDPDTLTRLLANLLDNALAAVPSADPAIGITVEPRRDQVELRITDNGPGIPEPDRERIFDRFHRLDHSTPGHGLGLAIARRIAREHGGDLVCHPSASGAAFSLTLPPLVTETRATGQ